MLCQTSLREKLTLWRRRSKERVLVVLMSILAVIINIEMDCCYFVVRRPRKAALEYNQLEPCRYKNGD